ncbi:MAG: protein-tyrosine-phosphatase [Planctomycetales bacterium]|nr:protein-tyrosine-phosphatase [Planctomycetales bacterium]
MPAQHPVVLFPRLATYINSRQQEFDQIPAARQEELRRVAAYIGDQLGNTGSAKLTFICTHNSRRSHLSQIWAKVAADVYGLSGVETFSGGTEATAFNPRSVAALRRAGLDIESHDNEADNPCYQVRHADGVAAQKCFSKVYDQPPNPTSHYCAIMTCSQADDACPVVRGCDLRAPIRYEDPKIADDTPEEAATYDERARQICREMLFMMDSVESSTRGGKVGQEPAA